MDTDEVTIASAISDIAPDGDVVLLVGPEKTRLRVYSQCLRTASKVFNTMFGPTWSEGRGLSSSSPHELSWEEDDANALRTIFCVLHHRNAEVPDAEYLTPTDILAIAVLSDKYDLRVALQYARDQWLKPRAGLGLMDMGRFLTAALLFDDAPMFTAHSLELMLNWAGSYLELLDDDTMAQFLPFKTVYLLEQRRSQIRVGLSELLSELIIHMQVSCSSGIRCAWVTAHTKAYGKCDGLRQTYTPAKLLASPVADMIRDIQNNVSETDLKVRIQCRGDTHHEPLGPSELAAGKVAAVTRRYAICLDCIRGDSACETHNG